MEPLNKQFEFEVKQGRCVECILNEFCSCKDIFYILTGDVCENKSILVRKQNWIQATPDNIKIGDKIKSKTISVQNDFERQIIGFGKDLLLYKRYLKGKLPNKEYSDNIEEYLVLK